MGGFVKPVNIANQLCLKMCPLLKYDEVKQDQFHTNRSKIKAFFDGKIDNITSCDSMFSMYETLLFIPDIDTSLVTDFDNMFFDCINLIAVPELDMRKAQSCRNMFYYCGSLVEIKKLICDSLSSARITEMKMNSNNLTNITIEGTIKVYLNLNLSGCPNLTVDSLMSFINAFEDNTGGTQYTVTIGTTNLAKLTPDQIAVATNKNILLA